MKILRSLAAGLLSAISILARRVAFLLFFLGLLRRRWFMLCLLFPLRSKIISNSTLIAPRLPFCFHSKSISKTIVAIILFSFCTCWQSNANLIHSYQFNGNANDSVGSANGTLIGGATVSGGVLHLDGVSGYVQFASDIVPTSGSYSVILSALETAPVANYVELISQGFSGGPGFYIGHDPSENIRVSDSWVSTGVPFPSDGTFHTFALTVDTVAGDSKLYIDGLLVATLGRAISTTTGGNDTRFGRQFDPFAEYFDGELANIRIYNDVEEISSLPIITSPATATATEGQLFVYQVTASGTPTSYTATPVPAGLSFDSVSGILGGTPTTPGTTQIQLTASNSFGTGMKTLTLTVQPFPSSGPVIASGTSITARTGQPFSFEVFTTGGTATARLRATGLPPGFSYDPATGVISGTPTADGFFGVTLTVRDGAVTTTSTLELTFTSNPAVPVITSPRETALAAGQFFTYRIMAPSSDHSGTAFSLIGNLPLGLSFDAATGTISGTYNPGDQNGGALLGNVQLGTHNSSGTGTIPLSFFQAVPGTAVNVSTRLAVGTSDIDWLIGGFIVTGNAPKKVMVRAIGPSLTQYNVPNVLQDPTLELYNGTGTLIARNDDWHTTVIGGLITSNQSAAIQASGLAPSDHRESAMIVTLAQHTGNSNSTTGHYTVHVHGKDGTTGVASVEVYDLGTASLDVSSNAQLANISTRGMVQTLNNVMIGGFIVRGDMPATVIVRAIGPSLAQHGITNPLQDPTLELRDHNGTLIAFNDNWMSAPNRQAIINSGLAPSNNLESAILRSLSPGNYTAIVRGKNGTTGVALVEAYVLP